MITQEFILMIKFDQDQNNNSQGMRMNLIVLIPKEDGHTIFVLRPRVLLHHPGGDHPTAGGQHGIGTLHHGLSNRFVFSCRCENFRLLATAIPVQATGGVHSTPCRTHCSQAHSLSGSHPSLTFHARAWLKVKQCAFSENSSYPAQHFVHDT